MRGLPRPSARTRTTWRELQSPTHTYAPLTTVVAGFRPVIVREVGTDGGPRFLQAADLGLGERRESNVRERRPAPQPERRRQESLGMTRIAGSEEGAGAIRKRGELGQVQLAVGDPPWTPERDVRRREVILGFG